MSLHSDAKKVIDQAVAAGFQLRRVKHGGYAVLDGETVVARIPANGHGPRFWMKNAQRAIAKGPA